MKKLLKKLTVIAMAAMMVMAMGVTAFAAAPGEHSVSLYDEAMNESTHNPFTGADVSYDGDETTITFYTKVITYQGVSGYIKELTVEGENAEIITNDEYPTVFEVTLDGNYTNYPEILEIEFSLGFIGSSAPGHTTSGYVVINE